MAQDVAGVGLPSTWWQFYDEETFLKELWGQMPLGNGSVDDSEMVMSRNI